MGGSESLEHLGSHPPGICIVSHAKTLEPPFSVQDSPLNYELRLTQLYSFSFSIRQAYQFPASSWMGEASCEELWVSQYQHAVRECHRLAGCQKLLFWTTDMRVFLIPEAGSPRSCFLGTSSRDEGQIVVFGLIFKRTSFTPTNPKDPATSFQAFEALEF